MYNIEFYETSDGHSEIRDFLESLRLKAGSVKDARVQYGQAVRQIQLLQNNGTDLPNEIVRHIEGKLWELRPGNNRIFFFYYDKGTFVLLHQYRKKSQKTPIKEIIRARTEINDYVKRKENKYELGRI